jgi:hypothetical protein
VTMQRVEDTVQRVQLEKSVSTISFRRYLDRTAGSELRDVGTPRSFRTSRFLGGLRVTLICQQVKTSCVVESQAQAGLQEPREYW